MSLSNANISPLLREMGEAGWDRKMLVESHPLMAQLERKTDAMSGDYFKIPVQWNKPAGRSHDPAIAYAAEAGSSQSAFQVTPVSDYLIFRLDGLVVRKAKNSSNETAFVDVLEQEVKNAVERSGDNIAKEAYGSSSGSRGQVGSTNTTTLTLKNPEDAVHFYKGMQVQASQTDGGTLRDSGDYITVVSVSISAGTIVGDANWSNIASIANDDFLYARGDHTASCDGLAGWNPATAPGATPFYQVDRSEAPDFLGGMRYDGSDDSMETVFIEADTLMRRQTGNPFRMGTEIYINPASMGSLRIAKEGSRFIDDKNEYGIGIRKFMSPSGHVLVEDRDCPAGIARAIGPGCFMHMTNGDQPDLANADGVEMFYDNATDKYTASVVIDHNFGARKPQGLCHITLPTES